MKKDSVTDNNLPQKTEIELLEEQLNDAQKLFCRLYVTGTMTNKECYLTAYPNSAPNSAEPNASRLLKKDNIKRYINLLLDDLGESVEISDKEIIRELKRIAFHSKNDNAKIKALCTLGTITGLLNKTETKTPTNVINITVDDNQQKTTVDEPINTTFTVIEDDDNEKK